MLSSTIRNIEIIQLFLKNSFVKKTIFGLLFFLLMNICFAEGTDILKDPVANLFATFKGTIISLLIMAEIIGAYKYWHVTKDITKAVTGLVFVLLLTGWASTKF